MTFKPRVWVFSALAAAAMLLAFLLSNNLVNLVAQSRGNARLAVIAIFMLWIFLSITDAAVRARGVFWRRKLEEVEENLAFLREINQAQNKKFLSSQTVSTL